MEILLKNPLITLIVVGFIIFIAILALRSSLSPYIPVKALMTDAELNFYRQLVRVVPPGILVFSKVRIADVVDVKPSIKGQGRIKHFKPIAAKHFDFVLVDDKKMQVLGAIELNDSSHDKKERKERDEFVRKVMASAKLPLFEIKATRKYKLDTLKADMLALLSNKPIAPQTNQPASEDQPVMDTVLQPEPQNFASHPDPALNPDVNLPEPNFHAHASQYNEPHKPAYPVYSTKLSSDEEYKPKPLSSFMTEDDVKLSTQPLYDDPTDLANRLNSTQNHK